MQTPTCVVVYSLQNMRSCVPFRNADYSIIANNAINKLLLTTIWCTNQYANWRSRAENIIPHHVCRYMMWWCVMLIYVAPEGIHHYIETHIVIRAYIYSFTQHEHRTSHQIKYNKTNIVLFCRTYTLIGYHIHLSSDPVSRYPITPVFFVFIFFIFQEIDKFHCDLIAYLSVFYNSPLP